jgi:vacuolar-type H+-ATPase subunit F/Vma7
MSAPVFVGGELDAAGFRLCGVATIVPAEGGEAAALAEALARSELVLLGAGCAARIPAQELDAALAAPAPLLLVVPEAGAGAQPPDLARLVRAQLGLEA